jgi:hypothetical protein
MTTAVGGDSLVMNKANVSHDVLETEPAKMDTFAKATSAFRKNAPVMPSVMNQRVKNA